MFKRTVLLLTLFFIASTEIALATDYLFSNTAPVAVHKKRTSRHTFPRSPAIPSSASKKITMEESMSLYESLSFAIVFHARISENEAEIDKEALAYHAIDSCKESKIELDEVFHHTDGSEAFDILIYDPRFTEQRQQAAKYKNVKVAWDPLYDMSMNSDTVDAHFQEMARVMTPDCLPARFRFLYIGSKRYQEIRYGQKAWEKEEKPMKEK